MVDFYIFTPEFNYLFTLWCFSAFLERRRIVGTMPTRTSVDEMYENVKKKNK